MRGHFARSMRFPLPLTLKIARSIFHHRLNKTPRFATVLQLEPLHACNLACPGCGRIREYAGTLKARMPLGDCLAAAAECDAPMVSICGGEPLLYPHLGELVAGLRGQGRIVYVCTNGVLLRRRLLDDLAARWVSAPAGMETLVTRLLAERLITAREAAEIRSGLCVPRGPAIAPSPWFYWNVHLDGLEAGHDRSVNCKGVFRKAIAGIRLAKRIGFQVATNTTVYKGTDMAEIDDLFTFLASLGVDGHTVSPAYNFEDAARAMRENRREPDDCFLSRADTVEKFRDAEALGRKFPIFGTPVYLEFLAGKRELACSAWAIPTRNIRGWRGPCYLAADAHYASYAELLGATDWGRFGRHGGAAADPRCEHCMVHCGFEPTAGMQINARPGDLFKTLWFQFGPRPRVVPRKINAFNAKEPVLAHSSNASL